MDALMVLYTMCLKLALQPDTLDASYARLAIEEEPCAAVPTVKVNAPIHAPPDAISVGRLFA
jgi:hypothetical protein